MYARAFALLLVLAFVASGSLGAYTARDENGAPLFLTLLDLSATSGRATLGATVPTGMAVEVGDARIAPCVLAHEVLHFVGLAHVPKGYEPRETIRNAYPRRAQLFVPTRWRCP